MPGNEITGFCQDRLNQTNQLGLHQITQEQYDSYIALYFEQSTPPPPKQYDAELVKNCIDAATSCTCFISVYDNSLTGLNNEELIFEVLCPVARIDPNLDAGRNMRNFSLTLFMGFFAAPPPIPPMQGLPSMFEFSLARTPNVHEDEDGFVFRIIDTEGNVTHWDLSAGVPPGK